jgi:curli biogenesis system outer membrane secretion channel CsgG
MNFKYLKSLSIFLFLNLILVTISYADIKVKQVTVDGVGKTKSKAVADALVQALSQVKGIQISSKDTLRSSLSAIAIQSNASINNGALQDSKSVKSSHTILADTTISQVQQATYGYVKSYKMVSSSKKDDLYQVVIKVDIPEYVKNESQQNLKLKKVAILPFSIDSGAVNFGDVSRDSVVKSIQQGLVDQFTQSRKFSVVDRNSLDDERYSQEAKRILNGESNMANMSKFGSRTMADYILVGNITNFSVNKKQSSYYGENFTSYTISAIVTYRLLEVATMEVKWSNTVNENLSGDASSLFIQADNDSYSQASNYLVKQLTKKVSDQVIGVAYPLTVLKALDNNVYLDQGGERVTRGSIYNIFARGSVVKDISTGRLITVNGKKVATVKITDVMPKYSIGEIMQGNSLVVKASDKAYIDKSR